jgi:hypothetical protein
MAKKEAKKTDVKDSPKNAKGDGKDSKDAKDAKSKPKVAVEKKGGSQKSQAKEDIEEEEPLPASIQILQPGQNTDILLCPNNASYSLHLNIEYIGMPILDRPAWVEYT